MENGVRYSEEEMRRKKKRTVKHEANLELMIVDSQKRARFHIKDIGNEHLTLEMSRITATIPGLDLDRWNSGEGKISGKLTLSLDIDY